jgi:hypothetical protein
MKTPNQISNERNNSVRKFACFIRKILPGKFVPVSFGRLPRQRHGTGCFTAIHAKGVGFPFRPLARVMSKVRRQKLSAAKWRRRRRKKEEGKS